MDVIPSFSLKFSHAAMSVIASPLILSTLVPSGSVIWSVFVVSVFGTFVSFLRTIAFGSPFSSTSAFFTASHTGPAASFVAHSCAVDMETSQVGNSKKGYLVQTETLRQWKIFALDTQSFRITVEISSLSSSGYSRVFFLCRESFFCRPSCPSLSKNEVIPIENLKSTQYPSPPG